MYPFTSTHHPPRHLPKQKKVLKREVVSSSDSSDSDSEDLLDLTNEEVNRWINKVWSVWCVV
jgi:hypothetical protein